MNHPKSSEILRNPTSELISRETNAYLFVFFWNWPMSCSQNVVLLGRRSTTSSTDSSGTVPMTGIFFEFFTLKKDYCVVVEICDIFYLRV